jgi:prephenate dehydrogenase
MNEASPVKQVAIIGPGLIGRSVALAARRADPHVGIIEIDRGDPIEDARNADLIVLATPIDVILDTLRRDADVLRASVVVDVGSTKRAIISAARAAGLTRFVGGHPMAGAATSGAHDARADLFDGRPWFLVPAGAVAEAVEKVQAFVTSLAARPIVLPDDGAAHDRAMAALSHVPQIVASALMMLVADATGDRLAWAGPGLRDTTRLAQSSATVWRSLLQTNADEVTPLLRLLARVLEGTADQLDAGESVDELFVKANRARATLDACGARSPSQSYPS